MGIQPASQRKYVAVAGYALGLDSLGRVNIDLDHWLMMVNDLISSYPVIYVYMSMIFPTEPTTFPHSRDCWVSISGFSSGAHFFLCGYRKKYHIEGGFGDSL
jgi:hypothetical protein